MHEAIASGFAAENVGKQRAVARLGDNAALRRWLDCVTAMLDGFWRTTASAVGTVRRRGGCSDGGTAMVARGKGARGKKREGVICGGGSVRFG